MSDLRKAAEMALEKLTALGYTNPQQDDIDQIKYTLRQALAQPEQEQYVTKVVAMHEDGTYTTERIPLPKREWVGLTDEDKDELLNLDNWTDIVEAVEAKLKEKNT